MRQIITVILLCTVLCWCEDNSTNRVAERTELMSCAYIINDILQEYLYAAKDEYAFDLERRTVFTWAYRVPLNEGKWRIEKENDTILFFNHENFEYLFLDENKSDFFDGFAHLPFTLRSGEIPTQGAHWSLKQMASGKFVIRNIHYDTFLYAGHYHDAERRYALAHSFQWVKLYGFTDWNIRPCGP